jgi:hypothetical protein
MQWLLLSNEYHQEKCIQNFEMIRFELNDLGEYCELYIMVKWLLWGRMGWERLYIHQSLLSTEYCYHFRLPTEQRAKSKKTEKQYREHKLFSPFATL